MQGGEMGEIPVEILETVNKKLVISQIMCSTIIIHSTPHHLVLLPHRPMWMGGDESLGNKCRTQNPTKRELGKLPKKMMSRK